MPTIYLHQMYCAEILSDFARNKITVDVDCVQMLMYNARVWRRLCALKSCNELGLTNHSVFFKRGYFIIHDKSVSFNWALWKQTQSNIKKTLIQWNKDNWQQLHTVVIKVAKMCASQSWLVVVLAVWTKKWLEIFRPIV